MIASQTVTFVVEKDIDGLTNIARTAADSFTGVQERSGEDRATEGEAGNADVSTGIQGAKGPSVRNTEESGI